MVSLGIDLGTKNCCMAVCKGNEVDVIPYSNNSRTVPSYISFWNQEILFGDVAIKRMPKNLGNTVYDIKRLIGRQFSDPVVTSHVDRWDFEVIDKNESVAVGVDQGDEKNFYTPQELIGLLLMELKATAESYLGESVYNTVITVPTYFTDSQRQATVDAGRIAGFKEVRLLNEPTAAALAYNMKTLRKEKRTVLVFDFGGGTLDVSLVECEGENVRVLAIGGDQNLGGNDIDQLLVEYMESTYDLDLNEKQLFRLRMVCEEAKKQFSVTEEVDVELFDEDEEIVLERKTFNEICKDIYTKTLAVVESCLNGIKFDVDDVHELLMVGGSSKIQRIVTMLETHFKKPVRRTLNPDEAVAIGAAIYASKWNLHSSFKGVNYIKVCPYSLGIDVFNKNNPEQGRNIMDPLIKKLDPLPVKISKKYFTVKDLQTEMTFNIYSGEDNLVTNNKWLGHITIKGLKPVPSRQVGVDVTFELDMNGILNVSLSDPENGTSEHLKLVLEEIGYNEKDLKTTIDLIQKRYSKSLEIKAFKQRKNHLGDLCDSVKTSRCLRCDKAKARLEHLDFNAENSKWLEHVIKDLERH